MNFPGVSIVQSSKKTKIVREPNLRLKMSEYHDSSNNSILITLFPTKAILKLLFAQLQSITKRLSLIFLQKLGLIVQSDGLNQKCPEFSKILSDILDPRIPTFWNSQFLFPQNMMMITVLTNHNYFQHL